MTRAEQFDAVLSGQTPDHPAFFPDITTWYVLTRIPLGEEQPFWPGQYIPDDSPFHQRPSRLEGELGKLTFVDFYRKFGWGLPCHLYDWYEERLSGGVEKTVHTEGRDRTVTFHTPRGDLARTYKLDAEGTWSEHADGNPAIRSSCSPSQAPCGRRTWSCTIVARTDCSRRGHARRTGCALRRSGLLAPYGTPISRSCGTPISESYGTRCGHSSAPPSSAPSDPGWSKARRQRVSG